MTPPRVVPRRSAVRRRTPPLVAAVLAVTACDGAGPTIGASTASPDDALVVPVPSAVLQSRAIDRDALEVDVLVDGDFIEATRDGERWTVSATVPPGRAVAIEIFWYERIGEEGARLPLASLVRAIEPLSSATDIEIDPARYSSEQFDQDDDGFSNLVEREGGTGPYDGRDPGDVTSPDEPLVVPYFDSSIEDVMSFDGLYENVWQQSSFQAIDTLLIGGDPANPRSQRYSWGTMHDGESLYLIVRFEGEGNADVRTPASGEDGFEQDDALNLFIDPGNDRDEFLSLATAGGDDRYLAFPLPPDAMEEPPMPLTPFDEPANRPENVPESLVYGVESSRENTVAGWEIKLSLDELGIEIGRPFGIELHLDQDLDGEGRDERWAWAYPSRADREAAGAFEGYNFESPARFGTAVLAEPPG